MPNTIALNIIKYYNYNDVPLLLLVDKAYEELAQVVKKYHEKAELICFESTNGCV